MRAALALLALGLLASAAAPAAAQALEPPAACMALECDPAWVARSLYDDAGDAVDRAVCAAAGCLVHCMAIGCWPPGSWVVYYLLEEGAYFRDTCVRDPAACSEQAVLEALNRAAQALQAHWPQCPLGFC